MKYPVFLLLAVNSILGLLIYFYFPAYLQDYTLADNPDASTYVELGRSFWLNGEYSRNLQPPFKPEFTWTPGFPLLAGGLDILFGVKGIFILNVILSAFCSGFIYLLVLPWSNQRVAFFSGLLFSLDPIIPIYNFQAMSEIPFMFFMLGGLVLIIPVLFKNEQPVSIIKLVSGGLLLSISILIRPAGLYIPLLLCVAYTLHLIIQRKIYRNALLKLAIVFIFGYSLAGGWMLRNYCQFGIFSLTVNDKITFVYYTAGGAWQIHNNCTLDEAQKLIQKEYNLPSVDVCHNINKFDITPQEINAQMEKCRWKALFKYPASLGISLAYSVPKSLLSHETGLYAYVIQSKWNPPGSKNFFNFSALKQNLFSNSILLICIFLWSVLFQTVLIVLGTVGFTISIWKFGRDNIPLFSFILLFSAYVFASLGLFGVDCVARYRMPVMPVFYIFSAMAIEYFIVNYLLSTTKFDADNQD